MLSSYDKASGLPCVILSMSLSCELVLLLLLLLLVVVTIGLHCSSSSWRRRISHFVHADAAASWHNNIDYFMTKDGKDANVRLLTFSLEFWICGSQYHSPMEHLIDFKEFVRLYLNCTRWPNLYVLYKPTSFSPDADNKQATVGYRLIPTTVWNVYSMPAWRHRSLSFYFARIVSYYY